MIKKTIDRITDSFVRHCQIDKNEIEIYHFGFFQMFSDILNIITIIGLGIFLGELFEALIYFVAFMELRQYSGGFHASSPDSCYCITVIVMFLSLVIIKFVEINVSFGIRIMIILCSVIIILSPVENPNRPIDQLEEKIFKKRTIFVLALEIILSIIFYFVGLSTFSASIIVAQIAAGTSLAVGKVQERLNRNNT